MNIKNLAISVLAVVVIGLGSFSVGQHQGTEAQIREAVAEVVSKANTVFGSLTGPDISSPYLAINGLTHEYRAKVLDTATSTPCSFQSPAGTSTLVFASLQITTGTTTDTTEWDIAKATTPFATSTIISRFSVPAGTATLVASTTAASGALPAVDDITTLAPNTYLVWKYGGTVVAGTNKLLGQCRAEFIVD